MNRAPLTAAYRPQRFSDLAGQETIKSILSRAAAEDRIATAYLFSGTRGVGKTTVARILAKAVNCIKAPAPEPCNECIHCRQITQGACVDVIEIDAASNRGIEDARRIREDIGYAPMECRYKVFIIDEAHMLTVHAANALLKTLEEPPRHVTFMLATTEPHKILPTIISRCQHYSFKRLTQPELVAHLEKVLAAENAAHDPRAVQLLARRAAGSVRDAMSLLGQSLALGEERLEVETVRSVLGLAGQEIFFDVLQAIHDQDPLAINALLRQLLDQGLDLGFFLRELTMVWRNLFLLRQVGEKAADMLELTAEETGEWLRRAEAFSLPHIHACWQLTVEGQRRVLTSLEPAMALELLLLNLAYLPSLISLEQEPQGGGSAPARGASGPPAGSGGPAPAPRRQDAPRSSAPQEPRQATPPAAPTAQAVESSPIEAAESAPQPPSGARTWGGFLDYAKEAAVRDEQPVARLFQVSGAYSDGCVVLDCKSEVQRRMLLEGAFGAWIRRLVAEYFGEHASLEARAPENNGTGSSDACKRVLQEHPVVRSLQREMGAKLLEWRPVPGV